MRRGPSVVDPVVCPKCGCQMKVIAIIEDPDELGRILRHPVKMGRSPPGFRPDRLNCKGPPLRAKHKVPGRGITRYPNEYLHGEVGLIRLTARMRRFPWAKA